MFTKAVQSRPDAVLCSGRIFCAYKAANMVSSYVGSYVGVWLCTNCESISAEHNKAAGLACSARPVTSGKTLSV